MAISDCVKMLLVISAHAGNVLKGFDIEFFQLSPVSEWKNDSLQGNFKKVHADVNQNEAILKAFQNGSKVKSKS